MRALVTAHWQLKLVAILVAFTLWFFVATSEQAQLALPTPVEYVGLKPDLVLVAGQRESLDVEVRAVRSVVARLGPETVRARVDLTGLEAGESVVQLTPSDVQVPPGATVTRITPARLSLTVAPGASRDVKVIAQVRGAPADGHVVRGVSVEPPMVRIKGPRSTIDSRGEVPTLPIDVAGSRRNVTQSVGLMLPASTYLTREQTVRVTVEIAEDGMSQPQPGARDARKKETAR
ncbi:MAG TPA: CdaR family protein [Terriglobales bacterium]|nr:CdaR family protein [Terriglobales bacterium]